MSATGKPGNLFADAQAPQAGERFEELLRHRNLVVERTQAGTLWLAVHLHPDASGQPGRLSQ